MEESSTLEASSRSLSLYGSACDTCRRRRIRCDGSQPCSRCVRSGVSCTYGSVINRSSAVSYARHLERRVAELEALLRERSEPQSSAEDDSGQSSHWQKVPQARQQGVDMLCGPGDDFVRRIPSSSSSIFYGRFAGLGFIRTIRDLSKQPNSLVEEAVSPGRQLVEAVDCFSFALSCNGQSRMHFLLPSKQRVLELVDNALRTTLSCHDCLDHSSFVESLDELYAIDPELYSQDNYKFLALVYAAIALGRRCEAESSVDEKRSEHHERVKVKGLRYFQMSCEILSSTDSNDLDSIRTLIFQTYFLLSVSMFTKAYDRVAAGVAVALRMGLHSSSQLMRETFTNHELYHRRRVFATLNIMDTYLSSILVGMPKMLRNVNAEQTVGLREEYLIDNGQSFLAQNPTSPEAEAVFCHRIGNILAKILEDRSSLYTESVQAPQLSHDASVELVKDRETDLEQWHSSLPRYEDTMQDIRALQSQLYLRLWYSAGQLFLYRPFIHHLARGSEDPEFNLQGYEFGSACVRTAMQAIYILDVKYQHGLLHEACWYNIYLLTSSASILMFFVTSAKQRTTIEESIAAAFKAKDLLAFLGKNNLSAQRCYTLLSSHLDALPT